MVVAVGTLLVATAAAPIPVRAATAFAMAVAVAIISFVPWLFLMQPFARPFVVILSVPLQTMLTAATILAATMLAAAVLTVAAAMLATTMLAATMLTMLAAVMVSVPNSMKAAARLASLIMYPWFLVVFFFVPVLGTIGLVGILVFLLCVSVQPEQGFCIQLCELGHE